MIRRLLAPSAFTAACVAACASIALSAAHADEFNVDRCVNIGNALEAPSEGEWGHVAEKRYFEAIGETTIDTVRIPVRWDVRADDESPYTIDPAFFERVDEVIGWALEEDLQVILNIHHYDSMYEDPEGERAKFIAMWRQIADHYKDYPETVYFEVLNEPREELSGALMQEALLDGLAAIRETNPTRMVMLGGDQWNSIRGLPTIPETPGDENIVHTFHYYDPHPFTHQKAPWAGMPEDREVEWGSTAELQQVKDDAELAARHKEETGYPLFLGEYGVYNVVDHADRVAWTSVVTELMQEQGISTCVWSFTATFPVWDRRSGEWLPGMKSALGVSYKPEDGE